MLCPVAELLAQCDREQMVDDYHQYYMGSNVAMDELAWSGDVESCQPGLVSQVSIERSMMRINYFRRLAGVSSEIRFDTSLEAMCQQAALMMHGHNQLSHSPGNSWTCYTEEGKVAASKSNLALGTHSTNAISLYMRDPGANNFAVGHRRWILFSRGKDIGLGSTSRAHVMYVIHNRTDPPEDLKHITFTSEGFFPAPLVPDRWSFGLPRADFENSWVEMRDGDGNEIPLEVIELKRGFGDNTIVWEPDPTFVDKYAAEDRSYMITITDVVSDGDTTDHSYQVTIAPTSYPPICANDLDWDEQNCECANLQTTDLHVWDKTSPIKIYPNPAQSFVTVETPHEFLDDRLNSRVRISNTAGKLLKEELLNQEFKHIDISELSEGIYFVRFISSQFNNSQLLMVGR